MIVIYRVPGLVASFALWFYTVLVLLALNGFNLDEIIETGKTKRKYTRVNVSFGTADYYCDYEF